VDDRPSIAAAIGQRIHVAAWQLDRQVQTEVDR